MHVLFDTNILVDFLSERSELVPFLSQFTKMHICSMNHVEVLSHRKEGFDVQSTRQFLDQFDIFQTTLSISDRAAYLRRQKRLKTPDAIIYATALEYGLTLITRNTKDFKSDWPDVMIPYTV